MSGPLASGPEQPAIETPKRTLHLVFDFVFSANLNAKIFDSLLRFFISCPFNEFAHLCRVHFIFITFTMKSNPQQINLHSKAKRFQL